MQAAGSAEQVSPGSREWDAAVGWPSLPLALEILKALTLHHQVRLSSPPRLFMPRKNKSKPLVNVKDPMQQ